MIGALRLAGLRPAQLAYRDMQGLSPFRDLETAGARSIGTGLLVGRDGAVLVDAARDAHIAAVRADPSATLFGAQTDPRLPNAFFSKFNCPNCRLLDAILLDYCTTNPGTLWIIRHESP